MAAIWASCEYTKRRMCDSAGAGWLLRAGGHARLGGFPVRPARPQPRKAAGLRGTAARDIAIRTLCILLIRYARIGEGTKYDARNFA